MNRNVKTDLMGCCSDALQRLCIAPDGPVTTQLRSTSSASKANESSTEVLLLGRVCRFVCFYCLNVKMKKK